MTTQDYDEIFPAYRDVLSGGRESGVAVLLQLVQETYNEEESDHGKLWTNGCCYNNQHIHGV